MYRHRRYYERTNEEERFKERVDPSLKEFAEMCREEGTKPLRPISDPLRSWCHGPGDRWLGRIIVDVNKVYPALFRVYGTFDSMRYTTTSHLKGKVKVPGGATASLGALESRHWADAWSQLTLFPAVSQASMPTESHT